MPVAQVAIVVVSIGLMVNLATLIDAFRRWHRNWRSGLVNGRIIWFRSHLVSKACLFIAQWILLTIIFVSPARGNLTVEILRSALSVMMAATGWINMRSFRKLRDGK